MSELCLSSTTKKSRKFSSLLLSDLLLFFSFILSHPLYFSYFIFFSPYLLKVLSFLSPLFITTSLLLLALFTFSPGLIHDKIPPEFSESKVGFSLSTYNAIVEKLQSKAEDENEEFHQFEELEVYRIVFDTSIFDARDNPVEEYFQIKTEEKCLEPFEAPPVPKCLIQDKAFGGPTEKEIVWPVMEEKIVEGFLKEFDEFENVTCIVEEEKTIEAPGGKPDKVEEQQKEVSLVRMGSEAMGNKVIYDTVKVNIVDNGEECTTPKVDTNSLKHGAGVTGTDNGGEPTTDAIDSSPTLGSNLGSYGSMRREKEWKRTLACKLFEERQNVEGSEGMDSLWETYELDSSKIKKKGNTKKKKIKKKSEIGYYEEEVEEEEEEEEEYINGQLCCLQALKFSSGKMNLGMGRPNLVKISKAIKGIGWLHHLTKHGKKGYN